MREDTPPVFLCAMNMDRCCLESTDAGEASLSAYRVHVPSTSEWLAVACSKVLVLVDDFPVGDSCMPTAQRRVPDDATAQAEVALARTVYAPDNVSLLVFDGVAGHTRTRAHAAWHPAWIRSRLALDTEKMRVIAMMLALSFRGLRQLTVRMPLSVDHVKSWLDILWSLSPIWTLSLPHIVFHMHGAFTYEEFRRVLDTLTCEPGVSSISAPIGHCSWPNTFRALLSNLHIEFHPAHDPTQLREWCIEWSDHMQFGTFAASYAIVPPHWLETGESAVRCAACT